MDSGKEIEEITIAFCEGMDTFKRLNGLFNSVFAALEKQTDDWEQGNGNKKDVSIKDGSVIFKMLFRLYESHELIKQVRITMTQLYNRYIMIYGQPGAVHDLQCGLYPVEETLEYLSPRKQDGELLQGMLKAAERQHKSMIAEEDFFTQVGNMEKSAIIDIHEKLCEREIISDDEDACGYPSPKDRMVLIWRELLQDKHQSDDGKLLEAVAKLCCDFKELSKELILRDYKDIADVLLEKNSINENQLHALWYITNFLTSTPTTQGRGRKIWRRADYWTYFGEILEKFQEKVKRNPPQPVNVINAVTKYLEQTPPDYSYICEPSTSTPSQTPNCAGVGPNRKVYAGQLTFKAENNPGEANQMEEGDELQD